VLQHKVLGRAERWITSETLGIVDHVPFHTRTVVPVGGIPRTGMFEVGRGPASNMPRRAVYPSHDGYKGH
jgi:hypothetical protein